MVTPLVGFGTRMVVSVGDEVGSFCRTCLWRQEKRVNLLPGGPSSCAHKSRVIPGLGNKINQGP